MTRRVGVVVNPERSDLGDDVVRLLRDQGCDVTTAEPGSPDELPDAIDSLIGDGVDVVCAVGGDGTQRTAAERLLGTDVALAVIPGGTVNLLAQVLGVDDLQTAVGAAVGDRHRMIDLARVDDDAFVLNASTGWDASVIEHVDDGAKRFGRLGYTLTGLREWTRAEPADVSIELDGESWYDDAAITVMVMNVGQRASESIHLAPDAELDDGRLDVIVLRRHSFVGLLRTAWSVLRDEHAPRRELVRAQAAQIVVTWAREVAVQRDGDERGRSKRTTYHVDPTALRVMVPGGRS